MYIILLCIREMDEHTCYILSLPPNSQHDIKKYIIRIFNKTAHDCILIHIKKDMQNYSIILIVNYIK
jgi:hypothetical protein